MLYCYAWQKTRIKNKKLMDSSTEYGTHRLQIRHSAAFIRATGTGALPNWISCTLNQAFAGLRVFVYSDDTILYFKYPSGSVL